MKAYIFFSVLLLTYTVKSQNLSGTWTTYETSEFYGELHLTHEGNGKYSGHSYDKQGTGYCSYKLQGKYNPKNKKLTASNTTVIRKTSDHTGSDYILYYETDGIYEYLIGTIQVQANMMNMPFPNSFPGGFPSYPSRAQSPPFPVKYYRPVADPIIQEKEKPIAKTEPEPTYEYKPIPVPEPTPTEKIEEKKPEQTSAPLPIPGVKNPEKETPVAQPTEKESRPENLKEEKLVELRAGRKDKIVATYPLNNIKEFTLKIRDYGEEDNDIISVFLDDSLVVKNLVIDKKGKEIKLKIDPKTPHKLTFVANNLGNVAPNTSTVSIVVGNKLYTKKLFTDESSNAVIILSPPAK